LVFGVKLFAVLGCGIHQRSDYAEVGLWYARVIVEETVALEI